MSSGNKQDSVDKDRRNILKSFGTAAVLGTAGCLGDRGGGVSTAGQGNSSDENDGSGIELDPNIVLKGEPEAGRPLELVAESSSDDPQEYIWNFNGETAKTGTNVEITPKDAGLIDVELIAKAGGEESVTNREVNVKLWSNTELRKKHLDFFPSPSYIKGGSTLSIMDEDRIRFELPERHVEERRNTFDSAHPISEFINYDDIKGISYSLRTDYPINFEAYDLGEPEIESIISSMNIIDEGSQDKNYITLQGDLEGLSTWDGSSEQVEYIMNILPEEDTIQISRNENFSGWEDNGYDTREYNSEDMIDLATEVWSGEKNSVKKNLGYYLGSDDFEDRGILIDRIGMTDSGEGMHDIPDRLDPLELGFANIRSDEGKSGYILYRVMVDDPIEEKVIGALGYPDNIERGPEYRSIDETINHNDYEILDRINTFYNR